MRDRHGDVGLVTECDRTMPNSMSPAPHDYEVVGEDEGSLAAGGTYDVLVCRRCGRRAYSPVAD